MNLLQGINPVTRILGLLLLTTPLMFTIDWVSATVVLAITVLMVPVCGLSYGRFFKRALPILIVAPLAGIPMALYGQAGGETYVEWGLVHVTELSLSLAWAVILRVLAIALPVVLLSADVDPTDLGDGLAQVLRLPERFVIGTVAALRMLTLLQDDLDAMRRSRRARGIADQGRIRYWFSLSFGLLVMSLRRAGKLATAMEARGFGGPRTRTWARESKLRSRDWAVMAVCVGIAAGALALAWATGDLRPVWAVR
ncbi:energy-coupling factor transporter transmembrane protein EcfT [Corynebacterium sp. zg912]|uniref:Energy-coupling factor transporter transmembrane protein EcfT n=1 Tax=Corynebacterium wankanglinii TaxID=2735136 RepID=A0A7H0KBZ2_9CORY|nr:MULTISPECIES: energy-coupling factor transporter transmembrane component T [Corynebacterium]MBA1837674.1 energy-coupling factor transporter transmembrane protein EcfT [Corynebacterium wankanglinii]MCR5928870.1 energy-coupling factor transporter transmembrane protein EcfT [Corynebacterium sp. zg912]QNP94808.1 energy-coupling factor transporter transmembrane protein EcfT [Corynebacterium wankanglinii]